MTAEQQTHIHLTSIPCTQREMSDIEVLNEMQGGFDKADVLTPNDLKVTTIAGTVPTTIAD